MNCDSSSYNGEKRQPVAPTCGTVGRPVHTCLQGSALAFLARDSIYAIARYMPSPVRLSVRLSVCPSVRHTGGSVKDG